MGLTVCLSVQIYLLIVVGLAGVGGQADETAARARAQETRTWPLANATDTSTKPPNQSRISSNSPGERNSPNKLLKTKGAPDGARGHDTLEGVVQATRVARNVRRKLDQLNDRVSQLHSMIAQDHSSRPSDKAQARQEDDSLPAEDEKNGSGKDQWLPALQEDQSAGGSSGDADQSGNEPDESAPPTNATQTRGDQAVAATSTRWSVPVIQSVIPGREQQLRDRQQQQPSNQDQAGSDGSSEQAAADYKDASNTANDSSAQISPDSNAIDQELSGSNATQEALPSMMGPDWTPNQNYNYFSELNAKNHGGASSAPAVDRLQSVNNHSERSTGKFQNMTILNSDTDLANSYSNNGAQLSTANSSYPMRTSSASLPGRRATQAADSEQTSASHQNHEPIKKSNSVMTYTAGNYGKSSRDLHQTSTTSQPYYAQEQKLSWSATQHNTSESPHDQGPGQHQQREIRWPVLATPAPPSPSYTTAGENSDQTQLGLPPSTSNVPQATRYSDVMMPASNAPDSLRPLQQQHHRSHRTSSNVNNHNLGPTATTVNELQLNENDDMSTTGDHPALSAHRYSMAQPSDHSDPSQRRRSLESRQQLTTSTDTTIYERQHQMQQPPLIDVYSSRVDSGPPGPLVDSPAGSGLNTSASAISAATTIAPTILSQDLKHRSTSNTMAIDDQLMNPYGSPSDGPSLSPMEAQQHQHEQGSNNMFIGASSPDSSMPASFRPMQLSPAQADASHYYSTSQADLQGQNMASSGHASDGSASYLADASDATSQQNQHQALMSHLDNRVNEMSAQDQQAYFNAQAAMSSRPYGQNPFSRQQQEQQFFSNPTSIQDAIQQASGNAESTSQTLSRQQQQQIRAAQMASAIGDYNAQVQRYQQKQLALAAHLGQQQQLQRALEQHQQAQVSSAGQQGQRSLVSPLQSLVRAYYSSPSSSSSLDQQPSESSTSSLASAIQNSMVRRYSPETTLANYLTARSSQSGNYGSDSAAAQPTYSFYQTQQQQATTTSPQQLYLPLAYNPVALKDSLAQAAYQRLLAQAVASNNQQTTSASAAQFGQLSPTYLANLQSLLASAQQQQQQTPQSSGGSNMLATAAMPQPVFYEAPSQMGQQQSKADSATGFTHDESAHSNARGSSSSSTSPTAPSSSNGSGSSRRSYLTSLFKPSASSRYYYAPTLLSPISLSPTALGPIYAPASAAVPQTGAESSAALAPALGQFYANPYALAAAMSQTAVAHAATHPFSHHANHHQHQTPATYQDAQTLAAAQQYQQALAAAASASALQPHYISATPTQALDTEMAESSMVPSESSGSFASPSDNSNPNSNSDSNDSSTTKSGGSMRQWLTVASLLAGILPMGLVMASMLPMLSVAGRKKRELEFTARNFSEIFGTWKPSKILNAIMSASNDTIGLANATRVLTDLTSSASDRLQPSMDIVKFNQGKFTNNKSARLLGSHKTGTRYQLFGSTTQKPAASSNATGAQDSSTTLNLPLHSTTPLPNTPTQSSMPAGPIKSTVKKMIDKMNNLIVTAQKRKHRSSLIDTQWSLAQAGAGGLPNFFKNIFDFNEVKKYLADMVRAKLIASAQATNNQPLLNFLNGVGHHSLLTTDAKHSAGMVTGSPAASSRTNPDEPQPQAVAKSNKRRQQTTVNELDAKPAAKGQLSQATTQIQITTNESKPNSLPFPTAAIATTQNQTILETNSVAQTTQTINQKLDDDNSQKRGSLLSCLQNVICDLGGKLRKASIEQHSKNGTRTESDDRQMTRGILSQLIDYIVEADRETQIFGHDLRSQSRSGHNEEFIGPIQEAVLKQQCASSFVCLDPHKFRRIFAELKWPKRK